ncbi:hypothetical protein [Spongiibacter marinus]|uniref:hypothetical protein n=1 Tax=Spongiibacter marinus TaxID=354246 RepID=UPI001961EE97|nr:hypothetical protein [Spongiibacter marinus]MBM7424934.1 hypothetical protein [Spongiibacter marinus]
MKTRLKGSAARKFFAERLVDREGVGAVNGTAGPMKDAVQDVIDVRLSTRGSDVDLKDVLRQTKKAP